MFIKKEINKMDLKFCQLINFLYNDIEFVEDFLNFYKGFPFPSPGNWWERLTVPNGVRGPVRTFRGFYPVFMSLIKNISNQAKMVFFSLICYRDRYIAKKNNRRVVEGASLQNLIFFCI